MKASVTPQARQSQTPSTTAEQTQLPLLQLHFFKPSLSMWLIKLKTSKNNAICVCLKTPWFILIFPTKIANLRWQFPHLETQQLQKNIILCPNTRSKPPLKWIASISTAEITAGIAFSAAPLSPRQGHRRRAASHRCWLRAEAWGGDLGGSLAAAEGQHLQESHSCLQPKKSWVLGYLVSRNHPNFLKCPNMLGNDGKQHIFESTLWERSCNM
jgi:hypothetical protein